MNKYRRIVLGSWGLSGESFVGKRPSGYGTNHPNEVIQVLDEAYTRGIRLIDTASNYGNGQFYSVLEEYMRNTGNIFNLIVKAGRYEENGRMVSFQNTCELIQQLSPIVDRFKSTEYIFIKDPPAKHFVNGQIHSYLSAIQKEWPDKKVGISTHLTTELNFLPEAPFPLFIELEFNGINALRIQSEIQNLKRKNWFILGMQPLAYGFLSGKYRVDHLFADNDWRKDISTETKSGLIAMSNLFHSRFMADDSKLSPAIRALLFCLANPHLDQIIVGPKNMEQLKDVFFALDYPVDDKVKDAFREYYHF